MPHSSARRQLPWELIEEDPAFITAYSAKGLKVWIDYWRQICRRADLGPWSLPATFSACLPKSKQVGLSYTPYQDSLWPTYPLPWCSASMTQKKNSKGPLWTGTTGQNKCPSFYIVSPRLVVMATKKWLTLPSEKLSKWDHMELLRFSQHTSHCVPAYINNH